MIIAMTCFSVVALATIGFIQSINSSSDLLNAQTQVIEWGHKAIDQMNFDLTQARVNFQNDSIGTAYLARLQTDASYPRLSTSRLPAIDQTGTFHADTVSRTGNAMLFVKEAAPFITLVDGVTRSVSAYNLVCYYLSPTSTAIASKPSSLRLARWQSRDFADYDQVMAITPVVSRSAFASALVTDRGIDYLWVPRNDPTTAFYLIGDTPDADSDGICDNPDNTYIIQKVSAVSVISSLGHGRASVSWNKDANFWVPDAVPKFAILDATGDGFPHGLEVQAIGPTGARQILVRLVVTYYVASSQSFFSNESTTIVTMHEF
jgi:hypothetical protein